MNNQDQVPGSKPVIPPFNVADYSLSQNFLEMAAVKQHILAIPIRKPKRQDFIRTYPDKSYWVPLALLHLDKDDNDYLVAPHLHSELVGELVSKVLIPSITRQGDLFLWPIRLQDADGKLDAWNRSAHVASEIAVHSWVKVASQRSIGSYVATEPEISLPDPQWPDLTLEQMLEIAFKDRIITDLSHPAIKSLRGEI